VHYNNVTLRTACEVQQSTLHATRASMRAQMCTDDDVHCNNATLKTAWDLWQSTLYTANHRKRMLARAKSVQTHSRKSKIAGGCTLVHCAGCSRHPRAIPSLALSAHAPTSTPLFHPIQCHRAWNGSAAAVTSAMRFRQKGQ